MDGLVYPVQYPQPEEDPGKKMLVMFVVVMIITAAAAGVIVMWMMLARPPDDRDGDDEPPDEPWEPDPWEPDPKPATRSDKRENLTSDTTWSYYSGLTPRFGIFSDTTLTVRESDIRIQLEDLALSEGPWFKIETGGSIVIRNSTIEVEKRNELDTAVIIDHTPTGSQPASLSRVVDLEKMDAPHLRLALRWVQRGIGLVVAVQEEPGAELEVVDVLSGPAPRVWGSHTVNLDEFKGTAPRIVLFPNATGADWLMVANLHVYDGTWDPWNSGDLDTGHPAEDGWLCKGFVPFYESWVFGREASGLIEGEGDLTIENSTIEAPDDLPRWWRRGFTKVRDYQSTTTLNDRAASKGVHIWTLNGTVSMDGAELENVPMVMIGSSVDILGSNFDGDADLVTITDGEGSVLDSTFRTDEVGHPSTSLSDGDKFQWGLSLEDCGKKGMFAVRNCTFRGMELALDTNNCSVDVTGCTFRDIQQIAIWEHDGVGPLDWETLSAKNDLTAVTEDLFLQSHSCIVDYEGEGKPDSNDGPGGCGGSNAIYQGCDGLPIYGDPKRSYIGAVLMMPTMMVHGNGSVCNITGTKLDLSTHWGGRVTLELPTSTTHHMVVFGTEDVYDPEHHPLIDLEGIVVPGESPGDISLTVSVNTWYDIAGNFTLKIYLDEKKVLEKTIEVDPDDIPWDVEIPVNLNVPSGQHRMVANLSGQIANTQVIGHLETQTFKIWRLANSSTDPYLPLFVQEGGILMLDPGVEVVLDGMRFELGIWGHVSVHIPTWLGARLTIEDLVTTGYGTLNLDVTGPCDLRLANVTTSANLDIYGDTGPRCLLVEDSSIYYFMLFGKADPVIFRNVTMRNSAILPEGAHLVLENVTNRYYAEWGLMEGGDVEVRDSIVGGYMVLYTEGSNVSVVNTTFKGEPLGLLEVEMENPSRLDMSGCTFDDFIVSLELHKWSWAANLTDCIITGDRSMLFVNYTGTHTEFFDEYQFLGLPGTTFDEGSTRIVADYEIVEYMASHGNLPSGVQVIAMYRPLFALAGTNKVLGPQNLTIRSDGDLERDLLGSEGWLSDELTLFVDVTEDPDIAGDPREVQLTLLTYYPMGHHEDPLLWVSSIEYIDMTSLRVEVQYTEWDDVDELVSDYLDGGPTAVP